MTAEDPASLVAIFATHNGAETLRPMLDGYAQLDDPGIPWRLIAVDNASTDDTPEVLREAATRLPIDIVAEPGMGKNRALNSGLAQLEPDESFVVFTDDDAIPDRDFLIAWRRIARTRPEDLFAGRVTPRFPTPPPRWLAGLSDHFPELYAQNARAEDGPIGADEIYGPNMAVRRRIFDEGARFDEGIGPNGDIAFYPIGSETEFCVRVARTLGARAWFAHAPNVSHIVRPWQMTPDFVDARAYRHGLGVAARTYGEGAGARRGIRSAVKRILLRLGAALGSRSSRWEYHWHRGFRDWPPSP